MCHDMNRSKRILAGTLPPGGATCLFPVIRELRRRPDVEVRVLGYSHSADIFREHGVVFVDLAAGGETAVTEERAGSPSPSLGRT